jgi:hypothetical protein
METSQALPSHAVDDEDLARIARGEPPFVSVYLPTEGDVENASQRSETRWRNLRAELEGVDADASVLAWIDGLIGDAHHAGPGLAAIADASGLRLLDHGPLREVEERAVVGDVPMLAPIIRWRQEQPTALVVLADRRGADVFILRRGDPDIERTVEGDDHPISKVGPGGWSQRRFQERAENTWEENAQNVADVVHRLADRTSPRVVAIAGDVRAVNLVQGSLRDDVAGLVRVVRGERPWEGTGDAIPSEVHDVVSEAVREDGATMLESLREELGQSDLAVEGLGPTVEALTEARVAALLVAGVDDRVWSGTEPIPIASSRDVLTDLGVDEPREVSAADATIRAALASGAGVRVFDTTDPDVPTAIEQTDVPLDGVGALLRWTTADDTPDPSA